MLPTRRLRVDDDQQPRLDGLPHSRTLQLTHLPDVLLCNIFSFLDLANHVACSYSSRHIRAISLLPPSSPVSIDLRGAVGTSIAKYHPQRLSITTFDSMWRTLLVNPSLMDTFMLSMAPSLRSLTIVADPFHSWTHLSRLTNLTHFNLDCGWWIPYATLPLVPCLPLGLTSLQLDTFSSWPVLLAIATAHPHLTNLSLSHFRGDISERDLISEPSPIMLDLVLTICLRSPNLAASVMKMTPSLREADLTFDSANFVQRRETLATVSESLPPSLTQLKIHGLSVDGNSNQLSELVHLTCPLQTLHLTMENSNGPMFGCTKSKYGLDLSNSLSEACLSSLTNLRVINFTDSGPLQLPFLLPRLQTLTLSTQIPKWSDLPTRCPNLTRLDATSMQMSQLEFDIGAMNPIPLALVTLRHLQTFLFPRVVEYDVRSRAIQFPTKLAALQRLRDAHLGFTVE